MSARMFHVKHAACMLALALVCALAGAGVGVPAGAGANAGAGVPTAWADDLANTVNPQQMPDSSFIYDTSISELEKADSYLDGQTVQVTGEVVGDRIRAELDGDHCWVVLEAVDGSYSEVSLFMTMSASELIDTYGAYGKRGTVLQARGTFNLSCSEHEGLSDLHVDHVSVVSKGTERASSFDAVRFVPGIALVIIGFGLIMTFYYMRESRR